MVMSFFRRGEEPGKTDIRSTGQAYRPVSITEQPMAPQPAAPQPYQMPEIDDFQAFGSVLEENQRNSKELVAGLSALQDRVSALIGAPALRVWHDQALYKEAGGRETDAHQDQGYWPIAETDTLTAWIPFDGSSLERGAMGYVPGSHKFGVRKFVNIFFGKPEDLLASPDARGVEPVFVEVPRGAVAFHHGGAHALAAEDVLEGARDGGGASAAGAGDRDDGMAFGHLRWALNVVCWASGFMPRRGTGCAGG